MTNGYVSGKYLRDLRDDVEDIFPSYSSAAKATIVAAMIQNNGLSALNDQLSMLPERFAHETVLGFKHMGWDSALSEMASALESISTSIEGLTTELSKRK